MRSLSRQRPPEHLVHGLVRTTLPNRSHSAMSMAEAARYSAPVLDCAIGRLSISRWMRLDAQRIAARAGGRQRVVDMRLDGAGAVEGLAQADDPGVGVHANPEDVGELPGAESFNRNDFHGWLGGSRFVWEGCGLN